MISLIYTLTSRNVEPLLSIMMQLRQEDTVFIMNPGLFNFEEFNDRVNINEGNNKITAFITYDCLDQESMVNSYNAVINNDNTKDIVLFSNSRFISYANRIDKQLELYNEHRTIVGMSYIDINNCMVLTDSCVMNNIKNPVNKIYGMEMVNRGLIMKAGGFKVARFHGAEAVKAMNNFDFQSVFYEMFRNIYGRIIDMGYYAVNSRDIICKEIINK